MITGFFLNIWFVILNYLINLLPTAPFPQIITDSWYIIWGLMNSVNFLFPVNQLAIALSIYVVLIKTKFGVGVVKLIIGSVRGVNLGHK